MYIYICIYHIPRASSQASNFSPKKVCFGGAKGATNFTPLRILQVLCIYIYMIYIHVYIITYYIPIYIDICIQTSIKLMQRSDSIRRIPWFFWQERIRKLMLHFITWPPKRRCTFVGRTLSVMEVSCQSPAAWQLKKSYHETVAGFHRTCPGAFFRWNWRCPL